MQKILIPSLLTACLAAGMVGCGLDPSVPASASSQAAQAPQEAISQVGDVSIRASVVPTAVIGEAVARQYGIERSEGSLLMLVGVRQGDDSQEQSLPATITATATDLRGVAQAVEMREIRNGELLDYVGVVQVSPPETLRFDLDIVREGGASSSMQFTRDFFPR
ncbi:MAG: DUF4426 domain-containing protein [Pseudomonadota bacterium]|nr:DUF4426 domain-containing protein [Pseudomonadota bacterium]